jgi:hypothetical protein
VNGEGVDYSSKNCFISEWEDVNNWTEKNGYQLMVNMFICNREGVT